MLRLRTLALVASAATMAALPATAPAATKTYKVKSGTTTLTLDPAAVTNLTSMGITMTGLAPATTSGSVLKFPLKSGSAFKAKGSKVVSGSLVHTGALQMTQGAIVVSLTKPTVEFGSAPVLTGSLSGLAAPIGSLSFSGAKTRVSKTGLKISGVTMKLTKLAADAMNATFSVTGFHENDPVGTATITAKLKK
jgi:hypothetical protein